MTPSDVFARAVDRAHRWLRTYAQELGWEDDRRRTLTAFRATMQALRDRLGVQEAVDLGAQLPAILRGYYYEGWDVSRHPERVRTVDAFLDRIDERLYAARVAADPAHVARATFRLLADRLPEGGMQELGRSLPRDLRRLLPSRPAEGGRRMPEWYVREQDEEMLSRFQERRTRRTG